MKKIFYLLLVAYYLLLSNCLCAQTTKLQFDNGITFIHFVRTDSSGDKKGVGLVSVELFVKGGAFTETDKDAGITNLMLQIIPKGTANRTSEQIALETEMLGASIAPACANDYSDVSMIVPADNIIPAFDIFADIVNNPTFPENEFDKEKTLTIAAIHAKSDQIYSVAFDYFNELMFNSSYHRPIEGYESTVSSLTVIQISDCYRNTFKPVNMVLCIGGDISLSNAKKLAEKYFGGIRIIETNEPAIKEQLQPPVQNKPSEKTYTGKFQQSYVFTGYPAPDVNQKDYATVKVINAVLGGGMGSRLFNSLREENGLVYESDSFYPSRKSTGAFVLYAGMSKENLEAVQKIFTDEIIKLSNISDDELKTAKEYLKGTYLLDHRTIQRQAWYLGWWETIGRGYDYDQKYLVDIDSVSITDINTAYEKYLKTVKPTTVILK